MYQTLGFWVYPFMDYFVTSVAFYYVGLTIAVIILHFAWYGLTLLRDKHFSKEKGMPTRENINSTSKLEVIDP